MITNLLLGRVVFRTYQRSHIMPTSYVSYYHHRDFTRLWSPLLICRAHKFPRFAPYSYKFIRLIRLEKILVKPGSLFPVIHRPMAVLPDPGEVKSFLPCRKQRYTSGSSVPKAHINTIPLNNSHAGTC